MVNLVKPSLENQVKHNLTKSNLDQPEEKSKSYYPFETEAFHKMIQQTMKAAKITGKFHFESATVRYTNNGEKCSIEK